MAHQTGIKSSDELTRVISDALNGKIRLLKVTIDQSKEELVVDQSIPPNDTWEKDFDEVIPPCLDNKSACYIFYRMDERNSFDKYLWIFLNFTPNDAPVREKMLYSATKATLKKAFDSSVLIDDVNATTKEELTLEGYRKHVEAANAPPPLTREEYELKEIHESEDHVDIGTTTRHSHLHGVSFPIQSDAMDALNDLKEKKVQYVQLTINVDVEEIVLEDAADTLDPNSVRDHISETKPGYHIYLFKHTHEGDYQESFIFIYSCPGYKCGVKERMVYSSCKSPLSAALSGMGINLEKKIEIDDPKEITEEFLMSELHPIKQAHRTQFNKPKPPANRRPKT